MKQMQTVILQRCDASKMQQRAKCEQLDHLQFFGDLSLPFQLQTCADCATSHDRPYAEIFAQFC